MLLDRNIGGPFAYISLELCLFDRERHLISGPNLYIHFILFEIRDNITRFTQEINHSFI